MLPVGYDPSIDDDAQTFIRRRSREFMSGSDPRNQAFMFDDFDKTNGSASGSLGWRYLNTGTALGNNLISGDSGGVHEYSTGATAASQGYATTDMPLISAIGTTAWYCAVRMKITTAVTAQSLLIAGLVNLAGSKSLDMGFQGPLHATNFIFQYDGVESGSIINTGIAADTNYHVWEMVSFGDAKLHAFFDFGNDLGPVNLTNPATDASQAQRMCRNGTDAAARTVRYDWFAVRSVRS